MQNAGREDDILMSTKKSARPSWDEYFMKIAKDVATRSTCNLRHVGAAIVVDRRIVATGYNGAPHGMPHCTEAGCKLVTLSNFSTLIEVAARKGLIRHDDIEMLKKWSSNPEKWGMI